MQPPPPAHKATVVQITQTQTQLIYFNAEIHTEDNGGANTLISAKGDGANSIDLKKAYYCDRNALGRINSTVRLYPM